jgi:hypothetical protein
VIVVYVHGNGNKVREELLKRQWDLALFGRDAGSDSRMAYWAPLLHPEPLPDPEFDEAEQVAPEPADEAVAVTTAAEAAAAAAPDELKGYALGMGYRAEAVINGEEREAAATGAEALPLPRSVRTRIFEQLVEVTFQDVHAYFFRGYAERMRAVVRDALVGIDEPFVVVAHSLGTIIAYDVLREEAGRRYDIPLLVTVGSPLAVQEIQDLVTHPLEVPTGVRAWLNASDFRDVVALDHDIRPEYAPPERCTDVMVTNSSANHHGIREYLSAPAVRDPILAAVASSEMGLEAVAAVDEQRLNDEHGALLTALRPVLRYDSHERYFADSAASFVENRFDGGPMTAYRTRLLRSDGTLIADAGGELELDFLRAGNYPNGQPVQDGDRLDGGPEPVADARRRHLDDEISDVIYGRVAPRSGGGLWLQYWLFYFHSAKGIPGVSGAEGLLGAGLHQGDWELVQVGIPKDQVGAADPKPDVAVLAAHDYAHRIAWDEVDRTEVGDWIIYPGRASHATYPKAGRWHGKKRGPFSFDVLDDFADGGGVRREPDVQAIRIGAPVWVGWPGLWGSTKPKPVIGGGSPQGPWRQRPWRDPDGFAKDALPWRQHYVPIQEGLEAVAAPPAPPTVVVGREGADWTIAIVVPGGTEDAWAGTLTLASNGDSGPVLWAYDVSSPGPAPASGGPDA